MGPRSPAALSPFPMSPAGALLIPTSTPEMNSIIPVSQRSKLRSRKGEGLAQGRIANKRSGDDRKPSLLTCHLKFFPSKPAKVLTPGVLPVSLTGDLSGLASSFPLPVISGSSLGVASVPAAWLMSLLPQLLADVLGSGGRDLVSLLEHSMKSLLLYSDWDSSVPTTTKTALCCEPKEAENCSNLCPGLQPGPQKKPLSFSLQ